MSRLIMVGVLVGALLSGVVPATAQQGGIGDPLTLAASGVVLPYFAVGGAVSLLEVASPVSNNPNLHMKFFDATCSLQPVSVGIPLTTNDIAFQAISPALGQPFPGVPTSGLIAISAVALDGFTNTPIEAPIHSRVYTFDPADGTSRVFEPIIINTAEFPSLAHWWSPLRSAVTYFSPLVTSVVHTHLLLICPTNQVEGAATAYFGSGAFGNPPLTNLGFPAIAPPFPAISHAVRARIYEAGTEVFKRNVFETCRCFTQINLEDKTSFGGGGSIYSDPVEVPNGTYTELEEAPPGSSFTGYRSIFTVGAALNNFFGRLSNGSALSIQGAGPQDGVDSHR